MKRIAQVISWVSLAALLLAPVAYLAGSLEKDPMKLAMLVATVLWFAPTPLWMKKEGSETEPAAKG